MEESDHYEFYSNFWLNMHHFLYNKSLASSEEELDARYFAKMGDGEKEKLLSVFNYYQDSLLEHDLRTGSIHFAFKKWCIDFSNIIDLPKFPHADSFHIFLNRVKPIYEKYYWPDHHAANKKVLNENLELIKKYEKKAVKRLSELTKKEWTKDKIRVDISFHSKLERPYTNTHGGVHIVMDSGNNSSPSGNWLELLFHESSHHLVYSRKYYVGETIRNTAKEIGQKAPRDLWHAYLFYFSGVVTKEFLKKESMKDYELYMVRKRPFHWLFPYVDKHLPAYINGVTTLEEATKKLILDWHENRD